MGKKYQKIQVAHFISDSGKRGRQILYEFIALAVSPETDSHFFILKGNINFIEYLQVNAKHYTLLNYNPASIIDTIRIAWKMRKQIGEYDVVHTHYYDANILGILTSYFAGVPKRITTRHHNAFNPNKYPKKQVWIRKLINRLSTDIIAPCKSVKDTLINKENIRRDKVKVIYHPFDPSFITLPNKISTELVKEKYNIPNNQFVIGAVSSLFKIKGTLYILEAFIEFSKTHPNSFLIIANAHGEQETHFNNLIETHNLKNVCLIPYENDILSLYKIFNIIVHVPISVDSEAFGQVYIESMFMGIPGIFTEAGILAEIGKPDENCILVRHKNSIEIVNALESLYQNQSKLSLLAKNAKKTVDERFSLKSYRKRTLNLYLQS